mmetsp:Transcript_21088/g.58627  ORF Transcript_21088/g.58627 Transcript_21088/m.58627 type:complete len:221 (-) Transcript_21088:363-1025(-)
MLLLLLWMMLCGTSQPTARRARVSHSPERVLVCLRPHIGSCSCSWSDSYCRGWWLGRHPITPSHEEDEPRLPDSARAREACSSRFSSNHSRTAEGPCCRFVWRRAARARATPSSSSGYHLWLPKRVECVCVRCFSSIMARTRAVLRSSSDRFDSWLIISVRLKGCFPDESALDRAVDIEEERNFVVDDAVSCGRTPGSRSAAICSCLASCWCTLHRRNSW